MVVTQASVFLEPVVDSATTPSCSMNNNIVAAWIGVIWMWPVVSDYDIEAAKKA